MFESPVSSHKRHVTDGGQTVDHFASAGVARDDPAYMAEGRRHIASPHALQDHLVSAGTLAPQADDPERGRRHLAPYGHEESPRQRERAPVTKEQILEALGTEGLQLIDADRWAAVELSTQGRCYGLTTTTPAGMTIAREGVRVPDLVRALTNVPTQELRFFGLRVAPHITADTHAASGLAGSGMRYSKHHGSTPTRSQPWATGSIQEHLRDPAPGQNDAVPQDEWRLRTKTRT